MKPFNSIEMKHSENDLTFQQGLLFVSNLAMKKKLN